MLPQWSEFGYTILSLKELFIDFFILCLKVGLPVIWSPVASTEYFFNFDLKNKTFNLI
jgi:hypothetical protein